MSFNGAAALQRRRLFGPLSKLYSLLIASMGPPLFSDGDKLSEGSGNVIALRLQWGRRSSATETRTPVLLQRALRAASMGPPLFSDGDYSSLNNPIHSLLASMGPPLFSDGDGPPGVRQACEACASMGPPLFSDGDRCLHCGSVDPKTIASMGPPLFSDGDQMIGNQIPANRTRFNGAAALQRRRRYRT